MSDRDITEIVKLKGCMLLNTHNNYKNTIRRDILKVSFRNGDVRYIDTYMERDLTDVDYIKIIDDKKKEKTIFKEYDYITIN